MITQKQAEYLLELPKQIIEGDIILERKMYAPSRPINDRLYMVSKDDDEFSFFLEIHQSPRNQLKLTLHFQESEASIGLLRVDFNGKHKNPELENVHVPDIFKPYAGQLIEENHIHYFVEGYKPLAWAIPLNNDNTFSVKEFTETKGLASIFQAFRNRINLQTIFEISIQRSLL